MLVQELLQKYKDNYFLKLVKARLLSWNKSYQASTNDYFKLFSQDNTNMAVLKERARVFVWQQNMQEAKTTYDIAINKSFINSMKKALLPLVDKQKQPQFYQLLTARTLKGEAYIAYKELKTSFLRHKKQFDFDSQRKIKNIFFRFYSFYADAKAFSLEEEEKLYSWNKKHIHALEKQEELTNFNTKDQEILFDYANTLCILGLYERSLQMHEKILEISPNHPQSILATQLIPRKRRPSLTCIYNAYEELGRRGVDAIFRNNIDMSWNIAINYNWTISTSLLQYIDKTYYNRQTYCGNGFDIALQGLINAYFKVGGHVEQKYYYEEIPGTTTGQAFVNINAKDWVLLELIYKRENMLDNYFALKRAVQRNIFDGKFTSNLHHYLKLFFDMQGSTYNDNNKEIELQLDLTGQLTNSPRVLRGSMIVEYKNTQHKTIYEYTNGFLTNLIYPYWTPKHYRAARLALAWRQDLSSSLFCGNLEKYYELKLFVGTDSEKNPMCQFDACCHWDQNPHFSLELKGYVNRSRLWCGNALWFNLNYQF